MPGSLDGNAVEGDQTAKLLGVIFQTSFIVVNHAILH